MSLGGRCLREWAGGLPSPRELWTREEAIASASRGKLTFLHDHRATRQATGPRPRWELKMRHRRRISGKKMRHRRRILDPRRRGEGGSRMVVRSGARLRGGKVPGPRLLHRRLLWSAGRTGGGPSLKKRRGRPHVSSLKRRGRPHVFGGLCLGRTEAPTAKRLSASAGGSRSASSLPEPICRVEAGWGRIKRRRQGRLFQRKAASAPPFWDRRRGDRQHLRSGKVLRPRHSIAGVAPAGPMPGTSDEVSHGAGEATYTTSAQLARSPAATAMGRERGAPAPPVGKKGGVSAPLFDEIELEHGV